MAKEFVFNSKDWKTPNTFCSNFKYPPNDTGVYLLVKPNLDYVNKKIDYDILYVGSSKKLKQRYENHEVLRMLTEKYEYVQFFFKECKNHITEEYRLINKIKPPYNKIGK